MTNSLGSYPNELVLSKIQPSYWFAAHLHVHYAAIVDHQMWKNGVYPPSTQAILNGERPSHNQYQPVKVDNPDEIKIETEANPDEIEISLSDDEEDQKEVTKEDVQAQTRPETATFTEPKITRFLSLDKCLPRRQFLQVRDEVKIMIDLTVKLNFIYRLLIYLLQMMRMGITTFIMIWSGFQSPELCNHTYLPLINKHLSLMTTSYNK